MLIKGCDPAVCAFDEEFGMKDALNTEENSIFASKTNSDTANSSISALKTSGKDEGVAYPAASTALLAYST